MKLNKRAFVFFWGLFILLNALIYFQNYVSILNHLGMTEGPTINAGSWTGRMHMLFGRIDYYFIKISGEILLFLCLFFFIKPSNKWGKRLLYLVFISLFVYNIYFEFNNKFYGITPAFRNDYVLLSEVLPIFLNSLSGNAVLIYIISLVFVILASLFFIFLIKKMLKNFELIRTHFATWISIGGLLLFVFVYSTFSSYKLEHQKIIDATWLSPKIVESLTLVGADKFSSIESTSHNPLFDKDLKKKPNIYLLFIESYGTVVTESPELSNQYRQQITSIEKRLQEANYHSYSNYSISPVIGGRSWLSFGSVMSGLKLENQIHYNDLIQKNHDYPHLIRYLNRQGYQSYRLSTMSNTNSKELIPYARTNRYWVFDEWWTYWDFDYQGHHYDALGGIPDQYALGHYRDKISKEDQQPNLLFFITMSSHVPWYAPPPLLDDWKDFNSIHSTESLDLMDNDITRYGRTIEYELELMTRFILEEKEESIFVLIGDHQPPSLEHKIEGITDDAATPIHIISRDSIFVERFKNNGFQKGLRVELDELEYVKHEDFYEYFMEHLTRD